MPGHCLLSVPRIRTDLSDQLSLSDLRSSVVRSDGTFAPTLYLCELIHMTEHHLLRCPNQAKAASDELDRRGS
jgi:hypothetical protein